MKNQAQQGDKTGDASVSVYYDDVTSRFIRDSHLRTVHYGLWGPDTKAEEETAMSICLAMLA